mgnify:CR=1 FL=1
MTQNGSRQLNFKSRHEVQTALNDEIVAGTHNAGMADPDWFLRDWAALKGKRQADLVTELGWLKNHAHRIWHGKQPYRRDIVNQVSTWLGIEPFELLMSPADALQLRQIREAAAAIVGRTLKEGHDGPPPERQSRHRAIA